MQAGVLLDEMLTVAQDVMYVGLGVEVMMITGGVYVWMIGVGCEEVELHEVE